MMSHSSTENLFLSAYNLLHFFPYFYLALSFIDIYYHESVLLVTTNLFQDDDEADTVGCCTLKVDNVTCVLPNKLQVLILIIYSA